MTVNPYFREFYDVLHSRFSNEAANMSYTDWLERHTTLAKKAFSTKGYEFQSEIINDWSKDLSVIKISQVGLSEVSLRKGLAFITRNQGTSVLYLMPTLDMRDRFSSTRVAPLLKNDDVFNPPMMGKPIRRAELFQVDQSFFYVLDSNEGSATSIPGDVILADEIELADPEMLALFNSRLQNSDWKIYQRFSTPQFENSGIDLHFKNSSQKSYLCKCESCGSWNDPRWTPEHIHISGLSGDVNSLFDITPEMVHTLDLAPEASFAMCTNCGSRLNLSDPTLREWTARFPSRDKVGYKVTPWSTDRFPVKYLVEQMLQYSNSNSIRRYYNTVLGESYEDASSRLSELDIRAVMEGPDKPEISPGTPVVVGLDIGFSCHLTLMALTDPHPVVFSFEVVPDRNIVTRIKEVLETYNVVGGCVDRYPQTTLSNEIRDISDGRIVPVEYAGQPGSAPVQLINDELGALSHARVNRTVSMDDLTLSIRKRKLSFRGYADQANTLVTHLRDQVRLESVDSPAVWRKTQGIDHYAHSLNYAKLALRVHNLVLHKSGDDPRSFFGVSSVLTNKQFDDRFGFRNTYLSP